MRVDSPVLELFPGEDGDQALFSPCGTYRYSLHRRWRPGGERVLWVMLNPSTADATQDDPTIRCIGFSKAWGYSSLAVANIFALRSTDPAALRAVADPIGPDNDRTIDELVAAAALVVAAWGVHGAYLGRAAAVSSRLEVARCLGKTKEGHPKHPLYVAASTELVPLNDQEPPSS